MKKWTLLITALLVCATLLPAGAGEVLGILEIRGLENLSSTVFDLSKTVGQPVPREIVSLAIHGMLGTMPGMGIEPNGTIRALWLSDETQEAGFGAVLLPVEQDGSAYLASLGQSGWTTLDETEDGLLTFAVGDGSMLPWREVAFLKQESTLLAARNEADARKAAALLAGLPPILPAEGVLALELRPAALMQAFSAQIEDGMTQAFRTAPGQTAQVAAIGELYAQTYIAVARQIDAFVLGLGVADEHLNLHTRLAPVPNGLLARWVDSIQPPAAAANVVNLPGALFAETTHLGDLGLLAGPYFRYMERMMELIPAELDAETLAAQMDSAKQYWLSMSGDLGMALLPPTKQHPLRFAEYVALKDPATLREINTKIMANINEVMGAMFASEPSSPFRIEFDLGEPREYRGIPVDRLTYRVSPGEAFAAEWPIRNPLELSAEMAWLDNALLVSIGGDDITEMLVDRALDGTTSPVSDLPAWQAFYPTPEPNLLDATHIALFDTLRSYLELVDQVVDEDSAEAIPDGPGHLSSLSYKAMGGYMTRLRFGLPDIAALARKVQEAQQRGREAAAEQMKAYEAMMESGEITPDMIEFEEWDDDDDWSDDDDDDWAVDDEDDWAVDDDEDDWADDVEETDED